MRLKCIMELKSYINKIQNSIFIETSHNLEDTVLIAGAGRSGTTWLGDIISQRGKYRYIFEPFSKKNSNLWHEFHIREYLRPNQKSEHHVNIVKQILTGNYRDRWSSKKSSCLLYSNGRVIKTIGANLFLKWMTNNFPMIKYIFLIRDPFAVAKSRARNSWNDSNHVNDVFSQDTLVHDYLSSRTTVLNQCKNSFEKHLFVWAVENRIVFDQFSPEELYIVTYEDLVINPQKTLSSMFTELSISYPKNWKTYTRKLKRSNNNTNYTTRNTSVLTNPRSNMNMKERDNALSILKAWNMDKLYTVKGILDKEVLYSIMST